MEALVSILTWIAKVTYFYMLSWWGIPAFVVIAFFIYCFKNANLNDGELIIEAWRYAIPRSILDASVWPLWLLSACLPFNLGQECSNNTDSILVGGILALDFCGWSFIRTGQVNWGLALMVWPIAALIWRALLALRLQIQDPDDALAPIRGY